MLDSQTKLGRWEGVMFAQKFRKGRGKNRIMEGKALEEYYTTTMDCTD